VHESENIDVLDKDSLVYGVHCKRFLGYFTLSIPDLKIANLFKT
jgi:hypothetical protein